MAKNSFSPLRILGILILVNLFLGILSFIIPKDGLFLSDNWSLTFPQFSDVFFKDSSVHVSLDSVLADVDVSDDIPNAFERTMTLDSSRRITRSKEVSTHPLLSFFSNLDSAKLKTKTIRVLHYGDSQLEGDRISSYLRKKLQLLFGGMGPGMILPIDISRSRRTILQSESSDWKKFAIYGNLPKVPGGKMGIGGSSYAYTGSFQKIIGYDTSIVNRKIQDSSTHTKDTLSALTKDTTYKKDTVIKPIYKTENLSTSWLSFKANSKTDSLCRSFSAVSMLYHSNDTCQLSLHINGQVVSKTLYPSPTVKNISLYKGAPVKKVTFHFTGKTPYVHGVLLDGNNGVAVDNFPMRGSSGLGFASMSSSHYRRMLQETNTKLIIMQYGVNVVPNPQKNYDYYYRMFVKQLQAMKAADSTVSILVIGPSDMSRKRMGKYESYPNIPLIRDAMKRAAYEENCAFWDLYSAMGGKNSMVSWVQNKPALAGSDFTHFNPRGAEYVGQMLFEAILYEYESWLLNRENNES